MTSQFQTHVEPSKTLYTGSVLSGLLGVGAILLMSGFATIASATTPDRQSGGPLRSHVIGDDWTCWATAFEVPAPLLTAQRNLFDPLRAASALEVMPLLKHSRFGRGMAENRDRGGVGACWTQPLRKTPVVDQAVIKSTNKGFSKGLMQVMRVPLFPSQSKIHIFQTRTILPEMEILPRKATVTMIGPAQETLPADQSGISSLQRIFAKRLASHASPSPFEGRSIFPTDALKTSIPLPVSESLRMNLTTTQALHGGNCANGCP
jgi:hypothetical protein